MDTVNYTLSSLELLPAEHCHDHAHLIIPMVSTMDISLDGVLYHVAPNHIMFIGPHRLHQCHSTQEVLLIDIPGDMINPRDISVLEHIKALSIADDLSALIALIKKEVRSNASPESMNYLYFFLYDKIIRSYNIPSLKYIEAHFSEDINIVELATMENYNINYFICWFRKRTGLTPYQYIKRFRVEKAKELLTSTEHRIIDISTQVGYDNNSSFTKAFKEVTGITPNQYRRLISTAALSAPNK